MPSSCVAPADENRILSRLVRTLAEPLRTVLSAAPQSPLRRVAARLRRRRDRAWKPAAAALENVSRRRLGRRCGILYIRCVDVTLTDVEARVLGALIEKEIT